MNETSRSSSRTVLWISILIAFLVGFFVGLVLFGWYLTPVEWTGGGVAVIDEAGKTNFLRAAIDSYAYRGDDLEALARYNSLGENKAAILSAIHADPGGLNPHDIEAFAAAVGASQALANPPAETGQSASPVESAETEAPGEPAETAEPAAGQGLGGWLNNPLMLGAAICAILVIAILLAVMLLAAARGRRSRAETPGATQPPAIETSTAEPSSFVPPSAEVPSTSEDLPTWLQPEPEEDPFQTVRLEEASLAQVFDQESDIDLAATPPHGLRLEEDLGLPAVSAAGAAEMSEELTDEDLAAISAQDFSTRMAQPGATAYIDESIVSDDFTDLTSEGQGWLEGKPGTELDSAAWMGTPSEEEPAASEPTPEEMAPFELDAPGFTAPAPEAAWDDIGLDLEEVDIEETPEETYAKFSQDIATVPGIGPEEAGRLRAIGITVPLLLLKKGATPVGRQQIAEQSGVDTSRLLEWVNDIDLFRVKGIDQNFARLLEAAGVETIDDLAGGAPQALYNRIREAAAAVPGLERLPSHGTVESWIAQAKKLPRSVSY